MRLRTRAAIASTVLCLWSCSAGQSPHAVPSAIDGATAATARDYLYAGSTTTKSGSIDQYPIRSATPVRVLRKDVSGASPIAFDAHGNLYLAGGPHKTCDFASCIEVFAPNALTPFRSIRLPTGFDGVDAMAFDSSQNLYIASSAQGSVSGVGLVDIVAYAAGGNKLIRTLSKGVDIPSAIAFDRAGNLYVANFGQGTRAGTITVYPPKADKPSRTITIARSSGGPTALAFDASGNLYVAVNSLVDVRTGEVQVYAAGSLRLLRTIEMPASSLLKVSAIALDSSARLFVGYYVTGVNQGVVAMYDPGSTKAAKQFTLPTSSGSAVPQDIAVDAFDRLCIGWSLGSSSAVSVIDVSKTGLPHYQFAVGGNVQHVAFGPP